MKRFLTILFAGLLIVAITAPAIAWEYSMKGEYEYRFRYLGRTGPNDLFGRNVPYALWTPPAGQFQEVGFAGPNIYGQPAAVAAVNGSTAPGAGVRIVRGGYSQTGSDALYYDSRLTLYPSIRVNPAIRVHGVYTVGGLRNKYNETFGGAGFPPFERYYMHQTSDAAYNTAAIGSWEQFRATIQLPWGIWSVGVKDFPFGTGATLANNTRAESFLWVVPYGPFRFLWPIWLARSVSNGGGYNTRPDGETKPSLFTGWAIQYLNGNFDMGGGNVIWRLTHVKAQYDPNVTAVDGVITSGRRGFDQYLGDWGVYAKYNNGRFFANAEYIFDQLDHTPAAVILPAQPTIATMDQVVPKFGEAYHWFAELGAMAGPAKVTLMAATASGAVRNFENPTKNYFAHTINYQAMEPYQFLMFHTYGGGNQTFNLDGVGEMSDAFCYAGRVDYAVASNLNVWGSYIWAHRLEKQGTLFGGYNYLGVPQGNTAASIAAFALNAGRAQSTMQIGGLPGNTYGYVSDGFIGWEANVGVDWKLLENLTAYFQYAYWQPGDWFTEAYQTAGINGGAFSTSAWVEGRDAINAFSGSLMINF